MIKDWSSVCSPGSMLAPFTPKKGSMFPAQPKTRSMFRPTCSNCLLVQVPLVQMPTKVLPIILVVYRVVNHYKYMFPEFLDENIEPFCGAM